MRAPSPCGFTAVPLPYRRRMDQAAPPPSPEREEAQRSAAQRGRGGAFAALTSLFLTAACHLAPIYAGGSHGVAATTLSQIQVAPIPDRSGYFVRQQLLQRLNPGDAPRYRLEITLDDKITGFGVRNDTTISRERRTLRARYRLVATDTQTVLLDATAGADEGIDVVQSEYAVVAAEESALERLSVSLADQIVARVALYARQARREMPAVGSLPTPGADAPVPLHPGDRGGSPFPGGIGTTAKPQREGGVISPQ